MYASFLEISEALHMGIFSQPLKTKPMDSLLGGTGGRFVVKTALGYNDDTPGSHRKTLPVFTRIITDLRMRGDHVFLIDNSLFDLAVPSHDHTVGYDGFIYFRPASDAYIVGEH